MPPLTISELELETGISRGAIYYYISDGLLPPAQKASATRAVYDESHVELLREIRRLKAEGLSLREVRDRLSNRIEAAAENSVDLVAKQNENTRNSILEAAARRFAERGYERTRIIDICKEVGITAQALYGHFPSKRHLFIACFNVYFHWLRAEIKPHLDALSDVTARLAWRLFAAYAIQALSPDLQALARVEAFHGESDLQSLVRDTYAQMSAESESDLTASRRGDANCGLFDDELLAYAMLGALEKMMMRSSWDAKYSRMDVMRNMLAIHLAIRAALSGRVDLAQDWATVADLAEKLAEATLRPPEIAMLSRTAESS